MILKEFQYYRPKTLKEAQGLLKNLKDVKILAGGTFLLTNLKNSNTYPKNIIGLKNIKELYGIKKNKDSLVIGAMQDLDSIVKNEHVRNNIVILSEAISQIATAQIRNMATIGGNICSGLPWADLGSIFLALNAELSFVDKKARISMSDFLKSPKKFTSRSILNNIIIPLKKIDKYAFVRMTKSNATDIPLGSVCIVKDSKGISITANLGKDFPKKFIKTEDFLKKFAAKDFNKIVAIFKLELDSCLRDDFTKEILLVCFKKALLKI